MKRIILTFALCISCILTNAQIQRNFFGCTIGSTTWNEAISAITKKCMMISESNRQNGEICIDNIKFAGNNFNHAYMSFYNGVLSKISFIIMDKELESYKDLKKKLKVKYSSYLDSEEDYNMFFMDDDMSIINLSHTYTEGVHLTVLLYLDGMLCFEESLFEDNEL